MKHQIMSKDKPKAFPKDRSRGRNRRWRTAQKTKVLANVQTSLVGYFIKF